MQTPSEECRIDMKGGIARHGRGDRDTGADVRHHAGNDCEELAGQAGRVKENVVPRPGSLNAPMRPPWASTIAFEIYNPSPRPRRSALPACSKRSKIRSRSAA